MRVGWKHVLMSLVALFGAGMLVVWLGIIDVRASSGHWRVTDWFLHWAMRSSVRTAALAVEAPPLDDPGLLPAAAGHYEVACTDCHGSPAEVRSPAVLGMLPPPPDLKDVVEEWPPEQLFEIVKHGIRYTGMPAWPAPHRDDEVWAMVAFLRQYPELDTSRYARLTGGMKARGDDFPSVVAYCESCHAAGRLGEDSAIPKLDGQSEAYILASLKAFRNGDRPSGIMQTAVNGLSDETLAGLARHYAARPTKPSDADAEPRLVTSGDQARKIPACSGCHDRAGVNPAYPRLAGLSARYIRSQLRLFRSGNRGGTAYEEIMTRAALHLTEADIEALARHYGR